MARHTFFCVDGHTCGNPVRLVAGGGPRLEGSSMFERRQHFLENFDWIRTGLMYEPRGHDMMSGAILYPPTREDCDTGVLYIETSGCLPMCGHGTIGTVTMAVEEGLVTPKVHGSLRLETPAGLVVADYEQDGDTVTSVTLTNVASFLAAENLEIECEIFGPLTVDVAYGGNFYAIVEPQGAFAGVGSVDVGDLLAASPKLRSALNAAYEIVHPENERIRGISHIMWTGPATVEGADARNAVFYGDKAIDRSPCGTGTSARMAQLHAKGRLKVGDTFVHESIINSLFIGGVKSETTVGNARAIVPTVSGRAYKTGTSTITLDERDPYMTGFQVAGTGVTRFPRPSS
ncbi:4-hydroxyproline epimerase [Rhizobiales bacterium]|uniref:4-hydroxyproline epimerase n=1 Tax=Hongsoonwoonella zoysiae TaxID=2821844 RepID=UPI001560E4BB|nr:4-hydroxyproline epimerase [Hongsoonwoonella zoysiae]NRG17435.1 4-hydroxyproline epimerase [Hongsoonwoonella zoysiae]